MKRLVLTAIAALALSAAPAASTGGNLLCHISFDDESKPFKAEVGKDAFVRLGKNERVEGLNKTKWTNEGGDGGVTVPKDTSIAIPVPDALAKESGRPYSVLLKLKLHGMATHPVFNMPADKMDDTLISSTLYGRLSLRQHERDVMSRGGYGVVPQGKIFTLLLCFGADTTTAFIDEKQILSNSGLVEGKLAGSRADCSKAGGYFLLRGLAGDPLPADITFYDVKIYDGVVDPHDAFSVEKKDPPPNTASPSPASSAGGNLLCHISFDDESKPFKAEVGKDAFVRLGKNERVEGLNKTKWTNEGGDGGVTVPCDTSIAIPVPEALAKESGRPYSVLLKLKLHGMATHPVFNMPADKMDDALITSTLYGRLCLRQHERDVRSRGGYGVVPQGKIFTLLLCFGADATTAFIDGEQILSNSGLVEGKLAGSRADCSKAGGYFLLRGWAGDPLPADITFYDVKIYDGVVDPRDKFGVGKKTPAENAEGAENKNSPSNPTSPSPVATPTANNPASPAGGKNGQTGGATSTNGGEGGASGNWLCRITFDDSANPLKAEGVADAFVRKGRKGTTERVSGMGDIKWTSAGGDGAVEIPKDWHIALPVPDKLAKEPGHPYSIEMRFRLSALNDWQPLLNMPADNASDALVYVNKGDSRLAIKQHNKAGGSAVYGESGFVVGKDHTLVLNFGANKTTAFLDGKQVFTRECTLAGSYADCSKAGGYFLIHGDEDGEGGTVTFYEVKVYDGAVGATTPAENAEGAENKNSPSNPTSPSPVATPTANNPPSPVATPTVNNPASPAGGNNGQTGEPSAEVQQTLTTFSEDNGLSAAEKIPALKEYIETHLDEPGIEKLIDLLEKLAKEANDEETLKWVEEIRKKLADKKSGGVALENPEKQGETGGNEPPNVNPADNGNPPATPAQTDPGITPATPAQTDPGNTPTTPTQTDPGNTPTTNPPAATNPAGGEDGGKKTGGVGGGAGDEPQQGSGKKPGDDPEGYMPPEEKDEGPRTTTTPVKVPDELTAELDAKKLGYWIMDSCTVFCGRRYKNGNGNPVDTCTSTATTHARLLQRWDGDQCIGSVSHTCTCSEPPLVGVPGQEFSLTVQYSNVHRVGKKVDSAQSECCIVNVGEKEGKNIDRIWHEKDYATGKTTNKFFTNHVGYVDHGRIARVFMVPGHEDDDLLENTYRYVFPEVDHSLDDRLKQKGWSHELEVKFENQDELTIDQSSYAETVWTYRWVEGTSENECWKLTEMNVYRAKDQKAQNASSIQARYNRKYEATLMSHGVLHELWDFEKDRAVMRGKFSVSSEAPPATLGAGETIKLKSTAKLEDYWLDSPQSRESLQEGGGYFQGPPANVKPGEMPKVKGRTISVVNNSEGPDGLVRENTRTCKITLSKDKPKLGDKMAIFFIACDSVTEWVYEWMKQDAKPTEEPDPEPPPEEPEEEQQGEAAVKFAQKDMGLPANKDKFVLKSEDKKKNKVGLDEYRIPFAVLNMPTNREYTVKAGFRRMGAAGEDGRYLEADAVKEPIPYSVEVVKDKEHGDKGLWEAVIKETGTYELPAGTSEGILLKVVAESGKKGDKDYVNVYETFPIYRIHLGLSFMLQANTIPCYLEMGEKSKYKLDKQDIAGDPEKDPDDKYVIRQEDFEVPLREGAMLLLLYDEDRADFIRIPAVPKATRVTATKVANDRYCQARDAEESHQELVDRLGIKAISTGKKRANGSHVVKIGPTKGVLDPPLRLLADLEVDAVYSNRVSNFTRTFTAKKKVLLHSQPMRVFENSDDERRYADHDAHIRKRLERIRFKIEGTCINRLFSLRNMIDRMIDGYDSRFGYDERQVKSVMDTYVGFIEGRFMGANGVPYKVTFSDDLKACYAFMQGLRDNTGFLGRMAMGVLTGGVSEHVFTTMTVLENMENEIMTCKDVKEFGFLRAVQIGGEEIGKQVLMEMIAQSAIQGVAKSANIDMNATMQMWAGRYRKAMDGADSWLQSKSSLYKAGDKALQTCKNFLGGGTKTAAKAVENVVRSEEEAAKRAEELLKKSRKDMSPAELNAVKQYEEAMENGLKKVRNLQKAQQAMEDAAKNNPPALKAAKEEYRRLADEVWSDKCALKKLQDVRGDYANRMRAQFNNYRENLLDSVQREALGDIAKEMGVPPDQLYLMNASNGVKTDYLTGKKVPGDRDISYMQKVFSDRTKDLTIDQTIGQRSVARRLWKKMHGGQEPPSIDEALKFMKGKDVTYVNPNGDAASYVFEHNLDGYEDLPGMVGMTKDGKINKYLLSNDLHNPTINAASIKHKGVEWWGPTASDKLARAAEWEALAAKYQGSAKAKLLEKAFDLRCQAMGDVCEGIRQITKQTDNIIVPRGANRVLGHPMPPHLQDLHALAKRVGQDVSPAEFTKALQKYKLDLNTWADQVSKCLNAKNVPVPEINVPNFFTPKAINDALDREKKKNGRR